METSEEALSCACDREIGDVLGELFALHRSRLWRIVRFRMDRQLHARIGSGRRAAGSVSRRQPPDRELPVGTGASLFIWLRLLVMQTLCDLHRHHVGARNRATPVAMYPWTPRRRQPNIVCLAALLAGTITSPSQAAAALEFTAQLEQAIGSMAKIDQEIIACGISRT